MTEDVFSREQERTPDSKAFAMQHSDLRGATIVDMYKKDAAYSRSKDLHQMCMLYAAAYADTMLQRLSEE